MDNVPHDFLQDVLDDTERLALQVFVENDVQREAVRKVLLFELYNTGILEKGEATVPRRNFSFQLVLQAQANGLSDEGLGKQLRSVWEGINFLESGFKKLEDFRKKPQRSEGKSNPAR